MITISEFQKRVGQTAREHGFDETPVDTKFLLMVGEIVEAQNEMRSGHGVVETYYKDGKPEGVPFELADAFIRILSFCEAHGINMEEVAMEKDRYNRTRPYKHGKAF